MYILYFTFMHEVVTNVLHVQILSNTMLKDTPCPLKIPVYNTTLHQAKKNTYQNIYRFCLKLIFNYPVKAPRIFLFLDYLTTSIKARGVSFM